MRLLLCVLAGSGGFLMADVTGTWSGSFHSGDREGSAHLILKQEGTSVTGTAGPDAKVQLPIRKGVAGGDGALTFEIEEGNSVMKFDLQVNGDEISGAIQRETNGVVQNSTLKVTRLAGAGMQQDITSTITALDANLFASYNACDLETFRSYLGSNIEFFHDKGGLTNNAEAVVELVKRNICGKIRRELVSIEVYPIPGYGAMEVGSHKFYGRSGGKETGGKAAAKFLHIWEQKGGQWKLTRVVSYAH
ncbi:MAG: nuclear transport factor 2 family protein [Bryobacterales bacterium]|nr:nuclear transport factor 2 family protein [Bryobacterales bacterium]